GDALLPAGEEGHARQGPERAARRSDARRARRPREGVMTDTRRAELTPGERVIRQFELINLTLALLAAVLVHVLAGAGPFLWGTLVGGALGVLNLRGMVFVGRRILRSQTKSRAVWMALFAFKLAILCTVVWLCLT